MSKENESKGQVRESEFGKALADLFREMETGHPPDQEVASFVRIKRGKQIQYGIVVNVGSKVPPQSEFSRGPDIFPGESAEDKMYVDVFNPLVDYFADVVIMAKEENGQIIPGPKLTVTLPYSTIQSISKEEETEILKLGYFFLYSLVDEVNERPLLTLIRHIPEKLKDNPMFDRKKYLATVVDLLTSLRVDVVRADIRDLLGALTQDGVGVVYKQEGLQVEIITFPSFELKSGDLVAIRDFQSNLVTIAIVMSNKDGIVEAQVELQRDMSSFQLFLPSRPVNRGSIVDLDVKNEMVELSRPRGPPNAVRIEVGNIYGTNLPYELELTPGRNCHCSLVAISEGGKSNTVKVIAYQAIKHKLPLGMLIFDEHGEYSRSAEDLALDVFDPPTYILADPFSDPESRVPLHWIPLDRFLEGSKSAPARPAFRRILQLYYNGPGRSDPDKPQYPNRLTVTALNWILSQGEGKSLRNSLKVNGTDYLSGYGNNTLEIVIRELRNLSLRTDVIQIEYDPASDRFADLYPRQPSEPIEDWEKRRQHLLKKVFVAQEQAKVIILDVSAITSTEAKMWLKRLILDSVVERRSAEYRRNKAAFERKYKLFMFVFEEATAAFDEETMAKIREYREFAVGARKFYCGYMPVMQDPTTLDPVLLSQLLNTIILKIPQEDLRRDMFKRLPCDASPFSNFIATASPGQGIIVNPVKKGLGNLPVPVQIHYFNDLVIQELEKAVKEYGKDLDKIVKQTRFSKEFVEVNLKQEKSEQDYESKY
ncbi:MAG: helicase HerA domain-containing protein [Nitrososphaerales archaeon]